MPRSKWRSPVKYRIAVRQRYGSTCWLCGKPGADSIDHVVPRSMGGPDTLANMRPAHLSCNSRRGNGLPSAPVTSRAW